MDVCRLISHCMQFSDEPIFITSDSRQLLCLQSFRPVMLELRWMSWYPLMQPGQPLTEVYSTLNFDMLGMQNTSRSTFCVQKGYTCIKLRDSILCNVYHYIHALTVIRKVNQLHTRLVQNNHFIYTVRNMLFEVHERKQQSHTRHCSTNPSHCHR